MHRRIRPRRARIARVSPEQNVPEPHGERERCVAQRDREHVNGQPKIVAQHRHKRIDARRHRDRHLMHEQQRHQRDRQRRQQINRRAIAREKDHPEKRHCERDPDDRLVHVCDRRPAGDQAAHHDSARVKRETKDDNRHTRQLQRADSARGRFGRRSPERFRGSRRPPGGARCATLMRDEQNKKPDAITPGRTIKTVEVIVEIFEAQLSILRINCWIQFV